MEIQYKSVTGKLEVKEDGESGKLHIRAYACAFNNVDSYYDVVTSKACDKWLASDEASRLALCYQHDMSDVIGVITDKGTDTYGMWFEADIFPTSSGKDVQILLKGGAIKEFSIGYYPVDYHYEMREGEEIRLLDEIRIIEISPVTRAANPKALLVDMKSEKGSLSRMSDEELEQTLSAVKDEYTRRVISRL